MGRHQTHGKGGSACFPMGFSPEIVTAGSQDNFMNLKHFIIYSEDDIKQLSLGSQRGQSLQQRGAVAGSRERAFQGAVLVSHAKNRTRETAWFEMSTQRHTPTQPDGHTRQLAPAGGTFPPQSHPENSSTSSSLLPAHNACTCSRHPLALPTSLQHTWGSRHHAHISWGHSLRGMSVSPRWAAPEPTLTSTSTTKPSHSRCSCSAPSCLQLLHSLLLPAPSDPSLLPDPQRGAKTKTLHGTGRAERGQLLGLHCPSPLPAPPPPCSSRCLSRLPAASRGMLPCPQRHSRGRSPAQGSSPGDALQRAPGATARSPEPAPGESQIHL